MGTISVNRLAGLSLIFGPIIAFVFFLIEPGGLLIDSADPSDAVGNITAKGSNAALTNITNIAIILGLALILSGLYALMRNVTLEGNGKAFAQMGFFMVFVGLTGWIFTGGIDFILADAETSEQISWNRCRLLRRLGPLLRRRHHARIRRLHLRIGTFYKRRLQPDNLPASRPRQPGRNDLLHPGRARQRRARHLHQHRSGLLRAAGHLVRISGLRSDEATRSRPMAMNPV